MPMEQSILKGVKEVCKLPPEDSGHDFELCNYINQAFFIVQQLGGIHGTFQIEDETATWTDAGLSGGIESAVRNYVNLKVLSLWDPPETSFMINLKKDQLAEMEHRLNIYAEVGPDGTG